MNTTTTMSDPEFTADRMFYPHPEAFIPIIVTHAATFIIGVIGNAAVIFTWTRKGQLRTQTTSFLVSLAVADLLLLVLFVPLETLEYFVVTWDESGRVCKITSYIEILSGMATVLNLVAVSIERFLVIVYPMRARSFCTVSRSRKGLILVWLLALVLAVPSVYSKMIQPVTFYNNSTSVTVYYCIDSNDDLAVGIAFYQLFILFLIPGVFMTVCYFIVIKVLWSSTKTIERLTAHAGTGVKTLPSQSSSMEMLSTGRRTTPPSSSTTGFATGTNSRSSKSDSAAPWTSQAGARIGRIRGRLRNGTRDEQRRRMRAAPFSPAEGPLPESQVDASGLQSSVRPGDKTNQFVTHLSSGEEKEENGVLEADIELNVSTVRNRPSPSMRKIPVQLQQTTARKQVIKMLLLVIVLFLICWGPRLIFNVVVKLELQSYTSTTYTIRVASYLLSFIHSALNPFVYGLMSSTFRNIIFKSCAGRDRAKEPDSCAASGRIVVGGGGSRIASGTWAGDEIVDDDAASDVRVVAAGRRRLLGVPRASSPTQDVVRMCNLSRHSRDFDPRERSFSQATVLTVAPMDVS